MVTLGDAGRSATSTYRGVRAIQRMLHLRAILTDIRYKAVVEAIHPRQRRDEPTPPEIAQSARIICDELDHTPVPGERTRGVLRATARATREHVVQGVRFPEWRHGMNATFLNRCTLWASKAAAGEKGAEALDLIGLERTPQREALFGARFAAAVQGLLLEPRGTSEGQEAVRVDLANEILHGISDEARLARYRLMQDGVNAFAAGLGTFVTSYLGFHQPLQDALELSGASFGVGASVALARQLGIRFLGEKQLEARRQAKYWLFSLQAWMVGYVVWGRDAVGAGEYQGLDQLVYIARALKEKQAEIPELPRDQDIQEDLALLIENSERAADGELTSALMRLQGVLRWRSEQLGPAIGNLVALVQSIPDSDEDPHAPALPNGGAGPPVLPGARTDPDAVAEPGPGRGGSGS
ncbi:hypothetical protein [Streptomyces griseus]|uniref:hypothetical protein n=1 Tax=Streptomyces griseus TaxID=1911 RepID=UPI00131ED014|nr:hypothetical protein [Streptomyces griseus]